MANANNSIITGKFRGSLGKELVFRDWAGKTVVAKAPKARTSPLTAAQLEIVEKFQVASIYAKGVIKNPDQTLAQAYKETLKPRQNLRSRIVQDYMKPPTVKEINPAYYSGAVGDIIKVKAKDDFRVTGVRVEIYEPGGALMEAGFAVLDVLGLNWIYAGGQSHSLDSGTKIRAIATDIPGNEGMLEITLP